MAGFGSLSESKRAKVAVCGDSGSGKTGLLSTLANAGYRVCVADFDDGLGILGAYLTKEGKKNVHFLKFANDPEPTGRSAYGKFASLVVNGWKDDEEDLGKIQEWGPDTVLAIDTGTFFGKAAVQDIFWRKKKPLDSQPDRGEWYEASRMVEQRLATLCSDAVKCHVVVNFHIRSYEDDYGKAKWWPSCVATTLSREVGGYFNTVVRLDVKMKGNEPYRVIRTVSDNRMDLKTEHPDRLKAEEEFDLTKILSAESS